MREPPNKSLQPTRDDRPVGLVPRALFLQRTTRAAPGPVVNVTEGVSQHGGFQRYENVVDNFSRPANNPARQRRSTVFGNRPLPVFNRNENSLKNET